ncbi:hypothetical protein [Aliiruegeria sabulilitoris]|uniref:hypothetical protein n=1 Tax=Aliiruegeria sabulilitoris TaxID=1510458 RepID=UPI0008354020|nr:hypothetical protein [Aliiruegeria sabulilitoris]NDR59542.1 hypothetical protein [Pseudoruegeria sp. M32A2M]
MMNLSLPETNAELALLWRKQLGVRGKDTLRAKLRRAPGTLPRALRREVRFLIDMEKLWDNPKLRRQIDFGRVEKAQSELRRFLDTIDPRDRLIGRIIGIIAPLMLNILLIFAAIVTWLVMTGRV